MSNIDLLIVGAGPVGLTLAVECKRYGIPFRIVEKRAEPSDKSKALGVWSGSIECMAAMGVADDFFAKSMPVHGIRFHDTGKFIQESSIHEGIESVYPIPFVIPQCWTEEILTNHLQKVGVKIERQVELTGMKNEESGVTATLTHADGSTETVNTKWLASCEGAHSYARHHIPVTFDGITNDSGFILADAKVEGELAPDKLLVNWGPTGVCIFFPIKKNVFRLFGVRPDSSNQEPPTVEEMNQYLAANGLGHLKLHDPEWLAYFSVNERYASRNRVGRVFLLGDAFHVHSPAGAQGMNTGMQDAFNLAWKLALLSRGKGDPEALAESYFAERHPIAKVLIDKTSKLLRFGMANGPFIRLAKDVAVKLLFQSNFIQGKFSGELSELHIGYSESPLVYPDVTRWPNSHGFEPGTKPRDATILLPTSMTPISLWHQFLSPKHTLILFSGKHVATADHLTLSRIALEMKAYGDSVQMLVIQAGTEASSPTPENATLFFDPEGRAHDRYGLDHAGWYLIRPDQYLAARSATLQITTLHDYLKKTVS